MSFGQWLLAEALLELMSRQYDLFTNSKNFGEFASTRERGISLEQIHNSIHWDAACGGQFLAAEFSAFDPLLYVGLWPGFALSLAERLHELTYAV